MPENIKPPKNLFDKKNNSNIPTLVKELNHATGDELHQLFDACPSIKAEEVFLYLEPITQARLLQEIDRKKALMLLEIMEPDDRAKLFDELPDEIANHFLRRLSGKERRATTLLLNYPNETAGRIMSPFFIALTLSMNVEEALNHVRNSGKEAETLYVLPVVDDQMHLKGIVELDRLVMAQPKEQVESLMYKDVKSFSVHDDQEKVARFIQSTDWLAVPIIEDDKRVVGIVTIDDAMDIMQLEETEDIIRGSASSPLRKPYLSVPVLRLMKIRVLWLFMLALAGTLTVNVLQAFEATLNQVIALALFIPLLIGIGGNTGSQSATTIVRALAVDDVRLSDFLTVAFRETTVGILLGLSLGLASYAIVWFVFKHDIAVIISLSLLAICTMAALTGSLMPLFARLLKLDPAVVSAPFVSTIIDASGLLIYFLIAKLVLNF